MEFAVTCSSTDGEWRVERRFKAFDELQHQLFWNGIMSPSGMPPKHLLRGNDVTALRERAARLQAWAADILKSDAALQMEAVVAFFGLDAQPTPIA